MLAGDQVERLVLKWFDSKRLQRIHRQQEEVPGVKEADGRISCSRKGSRGEVAVGKGASACRE